MSTALVRSPIARCFFLQLDDHSIRFGKEAISQTI